jgi:hypothetical protein
LVLVDSLKKDCRAQCDDEENDSPDALEFFLLVVEGLWGWLFFGLVWSLGVFGGFCRLGLRHRFGLIRKLMIMFKGFEIKLIINMPFLNLFRKVCQVFAIYQITYSFKCQKMCFNI